MTQFSTHSITGYSNNAFSPVLGGNIRGTTEADRSTLVRIDATIKRFRVKISGAALGSGNSLTFTIRVNGSNTALAVTLSDSDTDEEVIADVSVSVGDIVSIGHVITAGSPPGRSFMMTLLWESDTTGESFLSGETSFNLSKAVSYHPLSGIHNALDTVEFNKEIIAPSDFTISSLGVLLVTAPGSGNSRTFTLRKNGANESLSVTISGTSTSGEDTINSFSVAAGDTFTIVHRFTGNPTASTVRYGVKVDATNPREFMLPWNVTDNAATSTEYAPLCGALPLYNAARTNKKEAIIMDLVATAWYAELNLAPGSFGTRHLTVQDGTVDCDIDINISDTDTTGNWTGRYAFTAGDDFHFKTFQSGGFPSTPVIHCTLLCEVPRRRINAT